MTPDDDTAFDFEARIPGAARMPEVKESKKEDKKEEPKKKEEKKETKKEDKKEGATLLDLDSKDDEVEDPELEKERKKLEELLSDDEEENEEENAEEEKKPKQEEKKPKATKEESNGVLKARNTELKKKLELFGDLDPEIGKTIYEFLKGKFPDKIPTTEELNGEMLLIAEREKQIDGLKVQLEEQNKVIRELDIRMSPEFKKSYILPYSEAKDNLLVEFSNLDDNGKIIGPNSTAQFNDWLNKNIKDLNANNVKSAMTAFAKNFKAETGEEYKAPSIAAMMSAIRVVNTTGAEMERAYENWDKEKNDKVTKSNLERERQNKDATELAKRTRRSQASRAMSNHDYEPYVDAGLFSNKDEYVKEFSAEYEFTEGIFGDPAKAPEYPELIVRGFKARAFDRLFEKYKKLKEFKDAHDKDNEGSNGGNKGDHTSDDEVDWSDGKLK